MYVSGWILVKNVIEKGIHPERYTYENDRIKYFLYPREVGVFTDASRAN